MKKTYDIAIQSIKTCLELNHTLGELIKDEKWDYNKFETGKCYTNDEIVSRADSDVMWLRMGPSISESDESLRKTRQMHIHILTCKNSCLCLYDSCFPDSDEDDIKEIPIRPAQEKKHPMADYLKRYEN